MKNLIISAIRFYQKNVSPLSKPKCKYHPTCSQYGIEAIATHGVFKGVLLTVWRILRCNPFSHGGYDPVPQKNESKRR